MNCQTKFALLVFLLGAASLIGGEISSGQETDELLTEAPDSVRCYGRILADDGNPVEDSKVTLIAPHGLAYVLYGRIVKGPATISGTTDTEGEFSIGFSSNDVRFLGAGPLILMVQADGLATDAIAVPMSRLLVDLPLERTLIRCQPIQLRIVDADQKPVAGLQVRVARINKLLLPFDLENNPTFETDAEGIVSLEGSDPTATGSVYVQSESAGNQLIPVGPIGPNGDGLIGTLMPTGRVNGQIELSSGVDLATLNSRKALVVAWQSMDFAIDGPRSLSWQTVTLDEQGRFLADRIALGSLGFRFLEKMEPELSHSRTDAFKFAELTKANNPLDWKVPFKLAQKFTFTFVGEDGNPIQNLLIGDTDIFGTEVTMTDDKGEFSISFPADEKPGGQLFPQDAFGRISMEPFGISLDRQEYAGDGSLKPIRLARSRALAGRVVDESGTTVAGATVDYSYGEERFNRTEKTVSDNSGRFVIRNLPPNAALEISARQGTAMTNPNEAAHVVAGTKDEFTLVLVEQPVAAPIGRVLDRDGKPIAGATVAINRVTVSEKESYSAEQTHGVPWSAELPTVVTDSDGMFRYPATPGFGDRIQVSIQADGFLPFRAPFAQGSRLELSDSQLQLGEYRLLSIPEKVSATIRCIDAETDQPIAAADVVFIGARAGRTSATTSDNGTVAMSLTDTSQIAAVRADGYAVLFEHLDHVSESVEFKLEKSVAADSSQRLAWFERSRQDYLDAGSRLFSQMEKPSPGTSTYYRQSQYFSSQAVIDPAAFVKIMADPDCPYAEKDSLLLFQLTNIARQLPDQVSGILRTSKLEPYQNAVFQAQFAAMAIDPDTKDELFGEAIVGLGAMSGREQLMASGSVARSLILDGRIATAKSVVQAAWDAADEYRTLLNDGKQKNALGEARIFGPVLAIVDPDAALRLIPLLAIQQEVDSLRDQALGVLSLCDWKQFQTVCSDHKLKYMGGAADWVLAMDSNGRSNPQLVEWAVKTVELLDDSTTRMALCLFAARQLPPGSERDRLLAIAIHAWEVAEVPFWYHWSDPAKFALEQLIYFETIQPHELDELIFTCLNKAPATFDSMNLMGVLGDAARLLAMRDAILGRALLEPAFEDTVWLFDHAGRTWFDRNVALLSAVWIDPEWAAELAHQLSDRYSADDPVRQLQIFGSLITEMETPLKTERVSERNKTE